MRTTVISSIVWLVLCMPAQVLAGMEPVSFTDSSGKEITINAQPKRVVSLVPSITEMLLRIGAEQEVTGITYHSVLPPATADKEIIGGFFSPDPDRVAALNPDLIFYSSLHKEIIKRFQGKATLINLHPNSITESFRQLRLLGRIFGRQAEAESVIAEEERQLKVIAAKVEQIPDHEKQRVIRFMGRDRVMVPGDDSFQNNFIRAAGAIAPEFGRKGNVIELDSKEWQDFDPQIVYGCGKDKEALVILEQPGWNEVEAIQNKRTLNFPCMLTCRASTYSGYFVSWLAASIYGDQFSELSENVLPEKIVKRKKVLVELNYVEKVEMIESDIRDFRNKTVAIFLKEPMAILSTLEGWRSGISTVANHYFPPPSWGLGHEQGVDTLRQHTQDVLGLAPVTTSMLFTGADMDNLAVVQKSFKDLTVYALVTAGVEGNAVRMARDEGSFYELDKIDKTTKPGTINVILLANVKLSPRAMTRAMISATEAKSAALADLDIRSSYSSQINQATGTGTDNVLVIEGQGLPIDNSGGHSKMGELIARAVYQGVHEAIRKQNGLTGKRTIFKRLKERDISLWDLAKAVAPQGQASQVREMLERVLMQPQYEAFVESAFAISDDYESGLVEDLSAFDVWCQAMAEAVAGKKVDLSEVLVASNMPPVLGKAFHALLSGVMAHPDLHKLNSLAEGCEATNP